MYSRELRGGLLLAITAGHGPVFAAGFAISDKSVSGLGNAFAGAAALAADSSALYNNPAALTQLEGSQLSIAVHNIRATAQFDDAGSNTSGPAHTSADRLAHVPNFYYSQDVGAGFRAGIGVYSPFGLGLEYDADWNGRYHTIESNLLTATISPAIAYAKDNLAIGASLEIQYSDAKMTQAVDFGTICIAQQLAGGADSSTAVADCGALGLEAQQDDGIQTLRGDSWAYGFSLGLNYAFDTRTRAGLVYHSAVDHELVGTSDFEGVPSVYASTFTDSGGKARLDLPASLSLGLSHQTTPRLVLLAGYTWTGWSSFKELRTRFDNGLPDSVTPLDWEDASRYSLGANYQLSQAWLLRTGIAYDESPVPSAELRSPRVPDSDRTWYTAGFRWASPGDFTVDVAYAYISAAPTPINNTDSLGHTVEGELDLSGEYLSLQTTWLF